MCRREGVSHLFDDESKGKSEGETLLEDSVRWQIGVPDWDVVCRACGEELPPAFAGRPRSYCSVTCRQRAYRRRKSAARAQKATETMETTDPSAAESGRNEGSAGPAEAGEAPRARRSARAEAIMIRVRLDEIEAAWPPAAATETDDLISLDDLVRAALLLARRLRDERQPAAEQEPEPGAD